MNKKGRIVKAQKDLYYVKSDNKTYMSRARGVFRDRNIKPLVGDIVSIQVLDNDEAYIEALDERHSYIHRPPVANIDQILLVQSLKKPNINLNTFDKYLVMLEHLNIPVVIVINKIDLLEEKDIDAFMNIYSKTGYKIILTSNLEGDGIGQLYPYLRHKVSVLAGPSGVGKSSILNNLSSNIRVETGSISNKTSRGKHTTRHTELFSLDDDTYILDTPGFTSLNLDFIEDINTLTNLFPEIKEKSKDCKFKDCQHINEPVCGVKLAVENESISKSRYDNYILIREELLSKRRY